MRPRKTEVNIEGAFGEVWEKGPEEGSRASSTSFPSKNSFSWKEELYSVNSPGKIMTILILTLTSLYQCFPFGE